MSTSDPLSTVYCTDEDLAVRGGGDFVLLCPKWQRLAGAADGSIAAGGWVLTSATASFVTAGLATGHVVWLKKPVATFTGQGDLFAVESATATTLTLRRLGLAANAGQAPVAALTSSVEYSVLSLDPQIEEASFDLNRRYNIDPANPGRRPSDVYDLRDLRQATVLTVLVRRLQGEIQDQANAAWALRLKAYRMELDELMARLSVRWGTTPDQQTSSTWFGTRLVR